MKGVGITVALVLGAFGCKSCGGAEQGVSGEEEASEAEITPVGVIEGVVKMAAGATIPSYPPQRAALDRGIPEGCPPRRRGDREPVQADGDGLRGVHVTVVSPGHELPPSTPTTHEILIDECRLRPALIDATRGDEVVVKNESEFPFVPVLGRGAFGRALTEGQSRSFPLEQGGVFPLTCGFSASCGRSDVIVSYHPIHTQTAELGRFRLVGVPAGSQELSAWHPLFEETTEVVEVPEGETIQVTLTVAPVSNGGEPTDAQQESAEDAEDQAGASSPNESEG